MIQICLPKLELGGKKVADKDTLGYFRNLHIVHSWSVVMAIRYNREL